MTTSHADSERATLAFGLVEPMIPTPSPEPTDAPDRLYEIKWEGIRAISVVSGGDVRMHTRGGTDITAAFPEVAAALRSAAGDASVVLDGELVALSDEGIPQRYAVVERWLSRSGRQAPDARQLRGLRHPPPGRRIAPEPPTLRAQGPPP